MYLLNDFFVEELFRGKGISNVLMRQFKAYCLETGACGLSLETNISNVFVNNLYITTGFCLMEGTIFIFGSCKVSFSGTEKVKCI